MDRHRYLAWVFGAVFLALLAAPWLLPQSAWAALLARGFNWQKGVVLVAFAGMAAAHAYWLVQWVRWVRSLSFNTHRDPRRFWKKGGGAEAALPRTTAPPSRSGACRADPPVRTVNRPPKG